MKKAQINRFFNYLLYLNFCLLVGTGLLIEYRLPRGRDFRGWEVLGWDRHEWGEAHLWIGLVFLAFIGVHLLLHVQWLWSVATRKRAWILWVSLSGGLALAGLLFLLPVNK